MGKRYTKDEISQIQALTEEGLNSGEIASQIGRAEAGIRNIRYRQKMKADRKQSLKHLSSDRISLSKDVNRLRWEPHSLKSRKEDLSKVLQTDETTLNTRLQTALRKLKDTRPDLFQITIEEQIGKIAVELTGSLIKYIIK